MKIGKLVEQTGVSKDTIRYYEKFGLLKGVSRPNPYNNYKDYPKDNVKRILFILEMKKFGMTLNECKAVIASIEQGDLDDSHKETFVDKKLRDIEKKIEELSAIRLLLLEAKKHSCNEIPNPLVDEIAANELEKINI